MNATKILKSLLITALLTSAAAPAADSTIVIALDEGKQVASLSVGSSNRALKTDQIRCTPVNK